VNFDDINKSLIRFVSLRIRNGDCTVRQLAKLVGVSQPQLHNVLKGVRPLKRELADALLAHFRISLIDLLESAANPGITMLAQRGIPQTWTIARRPALRAQSSHNGIPDKREAS
jgi:transcriptional regulator with XRE-family HTH domain